MCSEKARFNGARFNGVSAVRRERMMGRKSAPRIRYSERRD